MRRPAGGAACWRAAWLLCLLAPLAAPEGASTALRAPAGRPGQRAHDGATAAGGGRCALVGQAARGALAPELVEAMKKVYALQFVGVSGHGHPRSPLEDPAANQCLTSLGPSSAPGGVGLGFAPCAHVPGVNETGHPTGRAAAQPGWEQLFQLDDDGTVYHCGTGLCPRLTDCGGEPVYDLGPCTGPTSSKFEVARARAGRGDLTVPLGTPLQGAVQACDTAGLCGPFLLENVCYEAGTASSGGCTNIPRPPVGWTRNASHAPPPGAGQHSDVMRLQPVPSQVGHCQTHLAPHGGRVWWEELATGEPDHAAWWYFRRYGDHPGYE